MPAAAEFVVKGGRELEAAMLELRREVLLELRPVLLAGADRARVEAQNLAPQQIANIGDRWSQFRIGVNPRRLSVYLAPRYRRTSRGSRRPNLGGELLEVMQDAVDRHEEEIVAGVSAMIDIEISKAGL
jgi:hypothetical protein